MSQQDQSPASLPIRISHQCTGGADLQVPCTTEAEKGLFLLCPPSVSPLVTMVSFCSHASGVGRFFSLLSQCCSISYHRVLDGEPHVLLSILVETGPCFGMTATLMGRASKLTQPFSPS